jgi:predicted Rossmann fold nucleotide-binding protein DprA/Smf involved in DNA uptake
VLQLTEQERAVLDATEPSETQIEVIIADCRLPSHTVSTILLQLEMRHLVKQFPGKYFAKLI